MHKLCSQKNHLCFFLLPPRGKLKQKAFRSKVCFFYASPSGLHHLHLPWWKKKKERVQQVIHFSIVSLCTTAGSSDNQDALLNFPSCGRHQTQSGVYFFFSYKSGWQDVILGWAQTGIAPKTVIVFINTPCLTTLHWSKMFCWNPSSFKILKTIFLLTFLMLSHIVSLHHDLSLTPYSLLLLIYKYHLSSVLTVTDQKPRTTSRLCGLGGQWERRDQPRLLRWHRLGEAES